MDQVLTGKVAVVTGASKGIGAGAARALAAHGASVVVNYVSSKTGADAVVAEITRAGGKAVAVKGDVSKASEARHPQQMQARAGCWKPTSGAICSIALFRVLRRDMLMACPIDELKDAAVARLDSVSVVLGCLDVRGFAARKAAHPSSGCTSRKRSPC